MAELVTTLTVVMETWVRIPAIDKTSFSRIFGNQRPIKQRHDRHLASRSTHDDKLCDCTMKYRVRVHDEGSSCSRTMTVLRERFARLLCSQRLSSVRQVGTGRIAWKRLDLSGSRAEEADYWKHSGYFTLGQAVG